jgi:hypothetical protein
MHKSMTPILAASLVALGCGGSFPVPTQLHLQLAQEQIGKADVAIKDGENERADSLLRRAKSDAELAIALTRDQSAKTEATKATVQSNAQQTVNANQGAAQ